MSTAPPKQLLTATQFVWRNPDDIPPRTKEEREKYEAEQRELYGWTPEEKNKAEQDKSGAE